MTIKREAFVYLGPARPFGLPLAHNSILAAEPEKVFPQLGDLFREHEDFSRLFVPVAKLGAARAAMKESGSSLNIYYNRVKLASGKHKAAKGN